MPRFSNQDYLARCHWLRRMWIEPPQILLATVTVLEQWDLHTYFQPSKALTDEQRLEHRRAVITQEPLLPARAGKCFTKLAKLSESAIKQSGGDPARAVAFICAAVPAQLDKKGHKIRIFPVARPEPDLPELSRVLLELAMVEETGGKLRQAA